MIYDPRIYLKATIKPPLHLHFVQFNSINPLNAELNHICHLLALLAHHILHVGRIRLTDDNIEKSMEASGYSEKPLLASHTV